MNPLHIVTVVIGSVGTFFGLKKAFDYYLEIEADK